MQGMQGMQGMQYYAKSGNPGYQYGSGHQSMGTSQMSHFSGHPGPSQQSHDNTSSGSEEAHRKFPSTSTVIILMFLHAVLMYGSQPHGMYGQFPSNDSSMQYGGHHQGKSSQNSNSQSNSSQVRLKVSSGFLV